MAAKKDAAGKTTDRMGKTAPLEKKYAAPKLVRHGTLGVRHILNLITTQEIC